jgi:glycosyltransferase involved in cell wall biosynthesis
MRIALVSTVSSPVRRDAHGSIEAWTWLLTRELHRLGHQVTVFGCAGSEADGEVVTTLPGPYATNGAPDDWQLCEWVNLCRAVEQSTRFEALHSQAYLWGAPLASFSRAPMLHTLHIVPDDNHAALWRAWPRTRVTALSRHQWSGFPDLRPMRVVPHGVDVSQFPFQSTPGDYLLYLGRFISGKGPLHAINIARALGLRLVLAGPENAYFREKVRPLVDGRQVEYAGFVRGEERSRLLGGARALLCPLQHPEPFGLVLVEAMLCGTPVAAVRLGAVPEIVEEGVTGFTSASLTELQDTVPKCFALDRRRIRAAAEDRFSAARMAAGYAAAYEELVGGGK